MKFKVLKENQIYKRTFKQEISLLCSFSVNTQVAWFDLSFHSLSIKYDVYFQLIKTVNVIISYVIYEPMDT